MRQSTTSGATPVVEKQGGYAETEQSKPSSGAQRKSERGLGRKMRDRNTDAQGLQKPVPADEVPGSADHGR